MATMCILEIMRSCLWSCKKAKPTCLLPSPWVWLAFSFYITPTRVPCSCACVCTCPALIFSGAAETHSRAEAAAGRTLQACGGLCDGAHPDSWGHEGWGHTHTADAHGHTLFHSTHKQKLGLMTFSYQWPQCGLVLGLCGPFHSSYIQWVLMVTYEAFLAAPRTLNWFEDLISTVV